MIVDLRGYNVHWGLYKTPQRARGLTGPPNDFYEVRGNASTEMDYEQFCAALEQAGVNWIRVKAPGRNNPMGSRACAFEPPPHGTFNYWNIALNPTNLAQYRANQHATLSPGDPAWASSNFGQLILAAHRHGVKLDLIPFQNAEFLNEWRYHAWNANNRYVNGSTCQAADRGFLTDARDAFTDPRALDAARARIDALLSAIEGYEHVIGAWELMAEQAWIAAAKRWPGMTWGDAAHRKLIDDLRNWNEVMCRYIQGLHPAPVGVSNAPAVDVRRDTIRATLFDAPSLDWVGINWYDEASTPAAAHDWLRDAQARYPGKQIIVQQYHPAGSDTTPNESAPWRKSKQMEWIIGCGEAGMVGGLRWMDIQFGTYASPNLREIASVTAEMAALADPESWGVGQVWDGHISSDGLALASAWGDGRHVAAFLRWAPDATHSLTLSGLEDGYYTAYWFDWLVGDLVDQKVVTSSGGSMSLENVPHRENSAALYLSPEEPITPSTTIVLRVTDPETGEQAGMALEAGHTYHLEVLEADA